MDMLRRLINCRIIIIITLPSLPVRHTNREADINTHATIKPHAVVPAVYHQPQQPSENEQESNALAKKPRDIAVIQIFAVGPERCVYLKLETEFMAVQGHPRSLISLPVESVRVCNFLLVIKSNLDPICPVSDCRSPPVLLKRAILSLSLYHAKFEMFPFDETADLGVQRLRVRIVGAYPISNYPCVMNSTSPNFDTVN